MDFFEWRSTALAGGLTRFLGAWAGVVLAAAESLATKIKTTHARRVRRIHAQIDTAPGVGESVTFALMINGGASALTVAISGAAQTSNSAVVDVDVAANAEIGIRAVSSALAAATGDIRVRVE